MSQNQRKGPLRSIASIFEEGKEVRYNAERLRRFAGELRRMKQADTNRIAAECVKAAEKLERRYQQLVADSFRKAEKR